MSNTIAFVMSHTSITGLGIESVKGHCYCPLCGDALASELNERLGAFVLLGGGLHGPVCNCCRWRWCPTFAEAIKADGKPGRTTGSGGLLAEAKRDESLGYMLMPMYEPDIIEYEELDQSAPVENPAASTV